MPGKHFFPQRDVDFKHWAINFAQVIADAPADVGVQPADAAHLLQLTDNYAAQLQTASEPGTRTSVAVIQKSEAKKLLVKAVRRLARIIHAFPGTTDPLRDKLGLHVPDRIPTRSGVPTQQASVIIRRTGPAHGVVSLSSVGEPNGHKKPDKTLGALLYYHIGPDAPTTPEQYRCGGVTTRTRHTLQLPAGHAGQTLWVMAQWLSPTGKGGPLSAPARAIIAA